VAPGRPKAKVFSRLMQHLSPPEAPEAAADARDGVGATQSDNGRGTHPSGVASIEFTSGQQPYLDHIRRGNDTLRGFKQLRYVCYSGRPTI
jgi:hypothetical protein